MNYNLPQNFQPYNNLTFCGNIFVNGLMPIAMQNNYILLIGKGDVPKIWLSIPPKYQKESSSSRWLEIFKNNLPIQNFAQIKTKPDAIYASFHMSIILEVKEISDNSVVVPWVDLRPLGMNIFGDEKELNIGTNKLVGNTFINTPVMISV